MTNVPAVKRVMSKDHVRDDKKSKMGAPWRGAAGKDDRAAAATAAASAEQPTQISTGREVDWKNRRIVSHGVPLMFFVKAASEAMWSHHHASILQE